MTTLNVLDQYPDLRKVSLEELRARKEFNLLLMRAGKHSPANVKMFNEINDILLLAINERLNTPKDPP